MTQVTWRAADELVEQVRAAAANAGRSLNEHLTWVMRAATDPDLAGDEASRLRERLARAGLLEVTPPSPRRRPAPDDLAAAKRAAGRGPLLSDIVSEQRG